MQPLLLRPVAVTLDPTFVVANVIEAGLWVVVAIIVLAKWKHKTAAIVLVAFGISDLVETQTGAWWKPWWLLAWKALCVIALLVIVGSTWKSSVPRGTGDVKIWMRRTKRPAPWRRRGRRP